MGDGLLQTGPDDALGMLVDYCALNPPVSRTIVARAAAQLRAMREREAERGYYDEELCEANRDRDPCGDCHGCLTAEAHRRAEESGGARG